MYFKSDETVIIVSERDSRVDLATNSSRGGPNLEQSPHL